MPKRIIEKCSPETQCSDEEIYEIIEENRLVESDEAIKQYYYPDAGQMKEIIKTSEKYNGEWYHSNVVLPYDKKKESNEVLKLREKIEELGKDSGIYLSYEFFTDDKSK